MIRREQAPDQFRAALHSYIHADIRPNVFSKVMIGMYGKAALLILLLVIVEILLL